MKNTGAKVADLLALVQQDYSVNGKRSKYITDLYINNQLRPKLGDRVANYLRKSHVEDYKVRRKKEGASEVTINRELAVLKRAFTLGLEEEVIERRPIIKLFPEPEPREGYYEHQQFLAFQQTCRAMGARKNFDGEVVADIVLFGYYSGWRLNECLQLHKDWIRVKDKIVILPAAKHKNKRPKVYPLEGRVWAMIEKRLENVSKDGLLFHRNGRPVKSIRRICLTVCDIAKLEPKHFFHNLRRSCTTNLDRAGVEKSTGMKITGHKTERVYDNYNQHSLGRLRDAVRKVEEFLEEHDELDESDNEHKNDELVQEMPMTEKQVNGATKDATKLSEVMAEREGFEPPLDVSLDLISSQTTTPKSGEIKGFLTRLRRLFGLSEEK